MDPTSSTQAVAPLAAGAYAVAALVAGLLSAGELARNYRRPPWSARMFGVCWLLIVCLDAAAGAVAVSISEILKLQSHATWVGSVAGWVMLGAAATLIVRANITDIPLGKASIPIGAGIIYGTLRSLIERPLRDSSWSMDYGEKDGRAGWIIEQMTARADPLTFKQTESAITNYVDVVLADSAVSRKVQKEIEAARRNTDDRVAITQLLTFMSEEGYITPLYRLLGRPSRVQVRSWRK